MKLENIEALDVYWYITYDDINKDFPEDIEDELLLNYKTLYGKLPRWNKR